MSNVGGECERIPIEQVNDGLNLVALNMRRLTQDHYVLMKDGSDWHALVFAIFALEELARYYILKQKKEEAIRTEMASIEVDQHLFGRGRKGHRYKLAIARNERLIPPDMWTIYTARYSSAHYCSARYDTEDVAVTAALRTQNTFVDWKDGKWEHGTLLDVFRLRDLVDSILHTLEQLESGSSLSTTTQVSRSP
jgi:AbiV family abortive infection protein